ncbi:hypothetical protein TNCV_1369861 [Trichonephila clavipes]|nr:hypothetical protein TNCV_1369861 [Trichonephila clavipes]
MESNSSLHVFHCAVDDEESWWQTMTLVNVIIGRHCLADEVSFIPLGRHIAVSLSRPLRGSPSLGEYGCHNPENYDVRKPRVGRKTVFQAFITET